MSICFKLTLFVFLRVAMLRKPRFLYVSFWWHLFIMTAHVRTCWQAQILYRGVQAHPSLDRQTSLSNPFKANKTRHDTDTFVFLVSWPWINKNLLRTM